jgi:hypothetical protein
MNLLRLGARNRAVAFATVQLQQFQLLHYIGIGDLQCVASEAQTSESPRGPSQD